MGSFLDHYSWLRNCCWWGISCVQVQNKGKLIDLFTVLFCYILTFQWHFGGLSLKVVRLQYYKFVVGPGEKLHRPVSARSSYKLLASFLERADISYLRGMSA